MTQNIILNPNIQENRASTRFEPYFLDAKIKYDNNEIIGQILDASNKGLAISIAENTQLPPINGNSEIIIYKSGENGIQKNLGQATILRTWEMGGLTREDKGIAVKLNNEIQSDEIEKLLFIGPRQTERRTSQEKISFVDMDYLGEYRRDLVNQQVRLFIFVLGMYATLAGIYFGIMFLNNGSINPNQASNIIFWRTLLAGLPGLLSISCLLMDTQKSILIQRIDAYLAVIKEYHIIKHYPREYKGWEIENRKFRHVLGGKNCKECMRYERKCGKLKPEEKDSLEDRNIFVNPFIDINYSIIYSCYYFLILLSGSVVFYGLLQFQSDLLFYMIIEAFFLLIIFTGTIWSFKIFYNLRKGIYSFDQFKRSWIDLLGRCRIQV